MSISRLLRIDLNTNGFQMRYLAKNEFEKNLQVLPEKPISDSLSSNISSENILNVTMEVVSEKTGYPKEMLELSMDIESDLGIDSIKRVEILGSIQDKLPKLFESLTIL